MVDSEFMGRKNYDGLKKAREGKSERGVRKYKKNLTQIIESVENSKIFVLSEYAGAGKTTIFKKFARTIKKQKKNGWVSFIDLKSFEDVFNKYDICYENLKITEVKEILLQIVDQNSKFDQKVFEKLFNLGRVVLFFDGVDEICPRHSNVCMKIFQVLSENKTGNQIWISTRPYYAERLEKIFKIEATSLILYTQEQKISYIKEILSHNNINDEKE